MQKLFALAACALLWVGPACAQVPSGTPGGNPTTSLTTTHAQVLPAIIGPRRGLFIQLLTADVSVGCSDVGTAVIGNAGTVVITGQYSYINWSDMGYVPNGAIDCVASGNATITVKAFPQ